MKNQKNNEIIKTILGGIEKLSKANTYQAEIIVKTSENVGNISNKIESLNEYLKESKEKAVESYVVLE